MARPDSISIPLFIHILGAMVLIGGLLVAATSVLAARGDARLLRLGYMGLLAVALPGYIVMRIGAEWTYAKEHLGDLPSDPTWVGIGYITADLGGAAAPPLPDRGRLRRPPASRRRRHRAPARHALRLRAPARRLCRHDLGDGRQAELSPADVRLQPDVSGPHLETTTGPTPGTRDRPSDTSAPLALRQRLHHGSCAIRRTLSSGTCSHVRDQTG